MKKGLLEVETVEGTQAKAEKAFNDAKAYAMNMRSVGSSADPNTTQESYILTNHVNSPGSGVYWHILTFFYETTNNNSQIAVTYNGTTPRFMIRHRYGSAWTGWVELASLTSPTFTGTPRSPTAPVGTNTTQIATTAFVQNAVAVSGDNTFAKDGKSYKYNFEVNESGGLAFVYEEL